MGNKGQTMDYLKDFFQKLMRAYPADFISLYANFSLPEELKNIIREQTTQAFEKLWKDPDFRLYMFYRHKTGKNISGTLDWVVSKVWNAMGGIDIKTPNVFTRKDDAIAYYKQTATTAQSTNFSSDSLDSNMTEFLDTIFHELTHEMQNKEAQSPQNIWQQIIKFNNKYYIRHKIDVRAYYNQPVEAEAYFVGGIVRALVQQKENSEIFAKDTIEYPIGNFDKGKSIYGTTLNPYQYFDTATNLDIKGNDLLADERAWKTRKKENIVKLHTNIQYLDKCIDFGRFVNGGVIAKKAIRELSSVATNKIYKKYVPDINRKVMDIYAKYKTDKKLGKQISMAVGYIKSNNPIVAYSAPENVSNRILIDITDRYL